MDVNKCLSCRANCCKLFVNVSKKEYQVFKSKGMSDSFLKHSEKFIQDNPQHRDKIDKIDSLYFETYAVLKKDESGKCVFLNKKTLLCSIYSDRPQACKDFEIDSNKCKKLYKCIS